MVVPAGAWAWFFGPEGVGWVGVGSRMAAQHVEVAPDLPAFVGVEALEKYHVVYGFIGVVHAGGGEGGRDDYRLGVDGFHGGVAGLQEGSVAGGHYKGARLSRQVGLIPDLVARHLALVPLGYLRHEAGEIGRVVGVAELAVRSPGPLGRVDRVQDDLHPGLIE